jgi:Ni2+-binding GTPase involved in maturation of urease and hydrogenase
MLCKEIRSNVETYYVEVKNNKGLDDVSRWVNSNRGR